MTEQRRLAAILVADVVGYSRLIGQDEAATLAGLAALGHDVIEPTIARHTGRLFKAVGDGFLVEFASAVQAVACAKAIQEANAGGGLPLRIGIHVGDVVVQGDDLMGDGVNIAARVEGVADPGGVVISRAVHEQVRDKLDISFVDKGEVALKNLARPVQVFSLGVAVPPSAGEPVPALALPDKPSIAVLPFQNMSGDPEQEYFVDGLVEDIITALSRFKSLFVIARNSSFTYKGKAVDIRQVGRELGVRYVLEGSVRKAAGRVRITGQLIDSESGAHLWADRFDGSLDDIFDLQDQVTTSVVGVVAPRIDQVEIERARRKPVENLDAYDWHLRGMAKTHEGGRSNWETARECFYKAISLDPSFAASHALAARCYVVRINHGAVADRQKEQAETRRLVERVSGIGSDDPLALSTAGFAIARVCNDIGQGIAMIDRALALNPNLAIGWYQRGALNMWSGEHRTAIEQIARGMRLNPLDTDRYLAEGWLANAHLLMGDTEAAIKWVMDAVSHRPFWLYGLRTAVASHALAGKLDEARDFRAQLVSLHEGESISYFREFTSLHLAADIERIVEGFRLAGLPE